MAAANSTSTATSGAISRQVASAGHPPRATRKRTTGRSSAAGAAAPAPDEGTENAQPAALPAPELPPPSNTGNETCCSMGNEEADSPLKATRAAEKGTTSLRTPKPASKVGRSGGSSARRGANNHLVGPVFSKPAFVVIGLLVLASMAWNWSNRGERPEVSTAIQVKELEDFSKKTTKWMQVQLELVDMKIGKEIDGLRKEVEGKMEEQSLNFGTSIRNLQAQVEGMDVSLQKLVEGGLLSKKEGLQLIKTIVQQRSEEEAGKALSLDEVRMAARQIVEAELEKHSADGIGRVDYALGSGGGKVLEHSEACFAGSKTSWLSVLGAGLSAGGAVRHPFAQKILEPSFGEPGQCLPLKGSDVFVEIALRTHIHPDAITIEHVPKSVAYDVTSAPRDFRVVGWLERGMGADSIGKAVKRAVLGEFRYNADTGPSIQTFNLAEEAQQQLINTLRIHFTSNHGSSSHTCIYRIRVHGFQAPAMNPS